MLFSGRMWRWRVRGCWGCRRLGWGRESGASCRGMRNTIPRPACTGTRRPGPSCIATGTPAAASPGTPCPTCAPPWLMATPCDCAGRRWPCGSSGSWSRRILAPYPVPARPLPSDVRPAVRRVYAGFVFLLACKWWHTPQAPTPFSWRFASAWCGLGERHVGAAGSRRPERKLQHFPQYGQGRSHTQRCPAHLNVCWLPPRQQGGDQDHEPRPWQAEENADPEGQIQPRQYHSVGIDHCCLPSDSL
jgi:hypothetical protein